MDTNILKEALKLPDNEKLELIEGIWESINEYPDSIPVTKEQKDELDRRLEDYKKNPGNVITWEVLKAELLSKK